MEWILKSFINLSLNVLPSFLSGVNFFFQFRSVSVFLSLLYGTQVYSFAAIQTICWLCLFTCGNFTLVFTVFSIFWIGFFLNRFSNPFIVHSKPGFLLDSNIHFSLLVFFVLDSGILTLIFCFFCF